MTDWEEVLRLFREREAEYMRRLYFRAYPKFVQWHVTLPSRRSTIMRLAVRL